MVYAEKMYINGEDVRFGGDNFHGQWGSEAYPVVSGSTLAGGKYFTYSLESYLPDDDYDYLVSFRGSCTSVATSGKTCQLTLFSGTTSSEGYGWRLGRCTARTAATVIAGGCARLPIFKKDRKVTILTQDSDTNNTGVYVFCCDFRRLGKNEIETNQTQGINDYPIGGGNFDGTPVMFTSDVETLSTGTTNADEHNMLVDNTTLVKETGKATFSVAKVIPDDGYDYDLCVSIWSHPPATTNNYSTLYVVQGTYTERPDYAKIVGYNRARTNSATYSKFKTLWLPISAKDKNISFFNTGNSTVTYNCMVHGFRRIGKND